MATLVVTNKIMQGTYEVWKGITKIVYTATYNKETNKTTVKFSESTFEYYGLSGYGTEATCTVTVSAEDSDTSKKVTFKTDDGDTTNGGVKTFKVKPSTSSVVINHSNTSGIKTVTISAKSTIKFYIGTDNQTTTTGSSTPVDVDAPEIYIARYILSIDEGANATIVVNRTSSGSSDGNTGNLSNGATLYDKDKLKITFGTDTGYALKTHTVNGSTFTSGNTHTVNGGVTVVATAEAQGLIYIYNGTSWDMYQVFIDNGTSWDMYIPYIDNGSGWDQCI